MTGKPDPNILLAYDFGLRRIGVATGNVLTGTATPLTTLSVGSDLPWDRLDGLVEGWSPGRLIVGLPDSSRSPEISAKASAFADNLVRRCGRVAPGRDSAAQPARRRSHWGWCVHRSIPPEKDRLEAVGS